MPFREGFPPSPDDGRARDSLTRKPIPALLTPGCAFFLVVVFHPAGPRPGAVARPRLLRGAPPRVHLLRPGGHPRGPRPPARRRDRRGGGAEPPVKPGPRALQQAHAEAPRMRPGRGGAEGLRGPPEQGAGARDGAARGAPPLLAFPPSTGAGLPCRKTETLPPPCRRTCLGPPTDLLSAFPLALLQVDLDDDLRDGAAGVAAEADALLAGIDISQYSIKARYPPAMMRSRAGVPARRCAAASCAPTGAWSPLSLTLVPSFPHRGRRLTGRLRFPGRRGCPSPGS